MFHPSPYQGHALMISIANTAAPASKMVILQKAASPGGPSGKRVAGERTGRAEKIPVRIVRRVVRRSGVTVTNNRKAAKIKAIKGRKAVTRGGETGLLKR